ncbi:ATP-dependent DNA ligase [uncultured Ilumatobacter sp.]|uniref:ATP-dependent DNA ligase n=1 Tax=uncultured Ilumatobacter sp. TaxID=879968 RepID=UPI00374E44CC
MDESSGSGAPADVAFDLPIQPPVKPMLAKLARKIPDGDGWIFEPKWDGFRCVVFRDGDRLELVSRNLKPLGRYFPELTQPLLDALPSRCIIDGEIVVADVAGNGLDFDGLLQRIHPAKSRIDRLAAETPAAFVAFDILACDNQSFLDRPMTERRALLIDALAPNSVVHLTPATTDRSIANVWFARFEGAGLDGIIAKPADGTYEPGNRALVKVKHQRTALCAVPGYRVHKDGNGVGSLLLGLFDGVGDGSGDLHSVGVAAAFSVARRAELLAELEPRTHDALVDHPWRGWAVAQNEQRAAASTKSGSVSTQGGSRWNAGKDLSFVPLTMGLVAEVTFGQLEGGRFRHGVLFVRWRPDIVPAQCRYDQLDVAAPVDFHEFIAAASTG